MFTDKVEPIISNGVETIGVKYIISKGIGTVIWFWNDDYIKLNTNKLNNILYLLDSPVNTLSATVLDGSIKDYEVTRVTTKSK